MRILIVTPAPPSSQAGNRVTARRWARLLKDLGHRVAIAEETGGRRPDVLVALHARKSSPSIVRFAEKRPRSPLVVALTGTDLYGDIERDDQARRSLQIAWRLVLLQPHGLTRLPEEHRSKARVIYQSAVAPKDLPGPVKSRFEVCVIGHLRDVKDPLRAARAARCLPETSKIRIVQIGAPLDEALHDRAAIEAKFNPRYEWLGELPRFRTLRRMARCRLLALTSKMEGGANVISEALVCSVPVISSKISGSIGLLGEDYPGYFEAGDTEGLAALLHRAETDEEFYRSLKSQCERLKPLFSPERERRSWQELLAELT